MVLDGVHKLDHVVDGQGANAVAQVLHGQDFAGLGVIVPGEGGHTAMCAASVGVAVEQGADHAGILSDGLAVQGADVRAEIFRFAAALEVFLVVGLSLFRIVLCSLQEVGHYLVQILLDGLLDLGIPRIRDGEGLVLDGDDHSAVIRLDVLADLIAAGQNGSAVSGLCGGGGAGGSAGTGGICGAGGTCCRGLAAAAGGQGQGHDQSQRECKQSFHFDYLFLQER